MPEYERNLALKGYETRLVLWDQRPRPFELSKLEKAWAVWQEAPKDLNHEKRAVWLHRELKKHLDDFEEWETGRYAVVMHMDLWRPGD